MAGRLLLSDVKVARVKAEREGGGEKEREILLHTISEHKELGAAGSKRAK